MINVRTRSSRTDDHGNNQPFLLTLESSVWCECTTSDTLCFGDGINVRYASFQLVPNALSDGVVIVREINQGIWQRNSSLRKIDILHFSRLKFQASTVAQRKRAGLITRRVSW